jgi:hypothetical protein
LLPLAVGQPVLPAQLVAALAPAAAPLQAHLFAPSRTVGFAQRGQAVQLRYAVSRVAEFSPVWSFKFPHPVEKSCRRVSGRARP